jgi:integrase
VAVPSGKGIRTFGEQSERWLERIQTRQRNPIKPATLKNWKSHLNVHILPVFRKVPLPDVTNKKVKDFVADLSTRIGPKSTRNIVQVIKMVKASAIDDEGNELYPTKWNYDFIDMPVVRDREQRRPSFSAEQIEAMVKAGDRTMQMATILFTATGLRAGELLGLEIRHFDGTVVKVEQEAWGGIIQAPKTGNAYRTIELDPAVSKLLNAFIGSRTTGYIFTNGGGEPIHQSNFLRRKFHPTLKTAGVPKSGFHGFRRYPQYVSAQRCRMPGWSAEVLARPFRELGYVRSIRQDP